MPIEKSPINSTYSLSRQQVCQAFRDLGAQPGDTIFCHSSFKSLGPVEGGAQTIFDGMLDACSPHGTIGMPSLWYCNNPEQLEERFDINNSPAYTGYLCEAMRLTPGACRSNHYSHAVVALGARAPELTKDHGKGGPRPSPWTERAFALESPWTRLIQWNTLYCFMGVSMKACTLKHWVEGEFITICLQRLPPEERAQAIDALSAPQHPGVWPYFNMMPLQEEFLASGLLQQTQLGNATVYAMRTQPFVRTALRLFLENPRGLLKTDDRFLPWLNQFTEL